MTPEMVCYINNQITYFHWITGSLHMSPGVLASMWKEEEASVKELEQKMKAVLKEKKVI